MAMSPPSTPSGAPPPALPPPPPPPPPEHSPAPTPVRAVQGFVACLLVRAALALYAVWALTPEEVLHDTLGLTFLPQKYWAVALPIYLGTVFVALVFVGYPSLGLCITPTLDDVRNVTDEHAFYYSDSSGDEDEGAAHLGAGGDGEGGVSSAQVGDVALEKQLKTVYAGR